MNSVGARRCVFLFRRRDRAHFLQTRVLKDCVCCAVLCFVFSLFQLNWTAITKNCCRNLARSDPGHQLNCEWRFLSSLIHIFRIYWTTPVFDNITSTLSYFLLPNLITVGPSSPLLDVGLFSLYQNYYPLHPAFPFLVLSSGFYRFFSKIITIFRTFFIFHPHYFFTLVHGHRWGADLLTAYDTGVQYI